MSSDQSAPESDFEKRKLLDKLLWTNHHVLIHLDSSLESVDIPKQFKNNLSLVLKISRNFVGGMQLTDQHVWAELKFAEERIACTIPYASIWGVTTEKGESTIWPLSMPKELATQVAPASMSSTQKLVRTIESDEDPSKPKSTSSSTKRAQPAKARPAKIEAAPALALNISSDSQLTGDEPAEVTTSKNPQQATTVKDRSAKRGSHLKLIK